MTAGAVLPDEPDALFQVKLPARPYPGLRPYEKDEWPVFFGRERMADAVAERLVAERLLVVHGDSGCGKSSLVRAGVMPRLEQESARGGVRWRTYSAVPGETPLWNIAEEIAKVAGRVDEDDALSVRSLLNYGRDAATALAERLRAKYPGEWTCLLIDQFEELFDHVRRHGADEAKLLTDFLVGLHEQRPEGLCAIVTMRSEFLGVCSRYRGFADVVNKTQYLLPAMGPADLMRAIREPATLFNGEVSRELAERLIADAGGEQDQLPLIQHGLMCLYDMRKGADQDTPWRLEAGDYRPLAGLLSDHADRVMATALARVPKDDGESRLVEDIFRALTDVNAGQAIRRRQTVEQVAAAAGASVADVATVAEPFRAEGVSFLRPYGSEPLAPDDVLDISHEALIRCWNKIAERKDGWLVREFRNGLVWRALLVQADSFESDPESILSAATAEERQVWLRRRNAAWAERYGGGWERVLRLVEASVKAAEAEKEEEKKALLAASQRRSARIIVLATSVFAILAAVLALFAWMQRDQAEAARLVAEKARTAAETAYAQERAAQIAVTAADERANRIQDVVAQSVQRQAKGRTVDDLLPSLEAIKDPFELAVVAQGVIQGAEKLTPAEGRRIADLLLKALGSSNDPAARTAVAQAMIPLAKKLTPDLAWQLLDKVVAAAKAETDVPTRQALQAVGMELADRLPDDERQKSIREIQTVAGGSPATDRLVASIPSLDAKTADERRATTQELISALRDAKLPAASQQLVVAALIDATSQLEGMSSAGRFNVLFVLSQIPASSWQRPGWDQLAAKLRANLAALVKRADRKEVVIGDDSRKLMYTLDQRLK